MNHEELLHKTAEMIASDAWNKANPQDLYHNQSTEMQAVLRANSMAIATLMVEKFYYYFALGYRWEKNFFPMQAYAEKLGLLHIPENK